MSLVYPVNYFDYPIMKGYGRGEFLDPPGMTSANFPVRIFENYSLEKSYGEFLPHYMIPDSIYYCTIRIHGSFPQNVIEHYMRVFQRSRHFVQSKHKEKLYEFFTEYDYRLDEGRGDFKIDTLECLEAIHKILWENNGVLMNLHAFSIMCNHIHFMLEAMGDNNLESVIVQLKRQLSKAINTVLKRGNQSCFQADCFNRIVRTKNDYFRYEDYIWNNPYNKACPLNRWSLLHCDKIPASMTNRWPVSPQGVISGYEKYYQRFYPVYKGQTPVKENHLGCF